MRSENRNFVCKGWRPWLVLGLWVGVAAPALAGKLDAKESEDVRQARQLYKSGNYQEAADIFSRLSAAHPDMPTFARNAGAAFYYLKKPDPALSNLREYLRVQKKIEPADREEVDKWIAEMEQLRAAAPTPAPAGPPRPPAGGATAASATSPSPSGVPPYADVRMGGTAPADAALPAAGQGAMGAAAPAGAPPAGYPPPSDRPYGVAPGQPQPVPGYPPGYPYPPAGTPTAPPTADGATAPAGQTAYAPPYGYAPAPGPQPGASVPPVPGEVERQARAPEKGPSALPWIIGGAGVAALGVGGVFTYLYRNAYSDTRAQYNPDRESAGRTYSYLQFVGYGLGAAGVTTAVILLLKPDHRGSGSSVAITPAIGPRLAGAELAVRY